MCVTKNILHACAGVGSLLACACQKTSYHNMDVLRIRRFRLQHEKQKVQANPEVVKLWGTATGRSLFYFCMAGIPTLSLSFKRFLCASELCEIAPYLEKEKQYDIINRMGHV